MVQYNKIFHTDGSMKDYNISSFSNVDTAVLH